MSRLRFPSMRAELLGVLAELSDPEYQRRVWIDKDYPSPTYYSDLRMVTNILGDMRVFPEPSRVVGSILIDGEEVERLRQLDAVLRPMIDDLGDEPDGVYIADDRWPEVVRRASLALAAMVRAGPGWPVASA